MNRSSRVLKLTLLLLTGWQMVAGSPSLTVPLLAADVAIVVHPAVPVQDLSLAEVRRVFMGDRQFWNPNLGVILLVRAPVARERDVVLNRIYRMTEAEFRQYWISKVFRAESVSGPKIVYSNEMAADLVASLPGGISFVDASKVPKNVKVVKINGLMPGEKGYLFH